MEVNGDYDENGVFLAKDAWKTSILSVQFEAITSSRWTYVNLWWLQRSRREFQVWNLTSILRVLWLILQSFIMQSIIVPKEQLYLHDGIRLFC